MFKYISNYILNIIYPPVCGVCGKICEDFLCKKCEILLNSEASYEILENTETKNFFQEHIYIFKYQGIIRKLLIDYKFNGKSYLYKTFVKILLKNQKIFENLKKYDTIIPVPISKKRKKERGYNQSYLIAQELTDRLNYRRNETEKLIEIQDNCITKTKNIIEQSKLDKEQRIENIKGVYELILKNKEKLKNKKILLLDDIYTTGSTVNECSKVLKEAEPEKISVLTIAKD